MYPKTWAVLKTSTASIDVLFNKHEWVIISVGLSLKSQLCTNRNSLKLAAPLCHNNKGDFHTANVTSY